LIIQHLHPCGDGRRVKNHQLRVRRKWRLSMNLVGLSCRSAERKCDEPVRNQQSRSAIRRRSSTALPPKFMGSWREIFRGESLPREENALALYALLLKFPGRILHAPCVCSALELKPATLYFLPKSPRNQALYSRAEIKETFKTCSVTMERNSA
jgi:hypothetical protein